MDFRNRWGNYPYRINNILDSFKCSDVQELRTLAIKGEIVPEELFRYKGTGNKHAPGKLARFLFDMPSKADKQNQVVLNNLGAGI